MATVAAAVAGGEWRKPFVVGHDGDPPDSAAVDAQL